MKNNLILIVLFLFFIATNIKGQGGDCLGAEPFCSGQNFTFPASTNTVAQAGANYSCLSDQPNPAWYFLKIGTAGTIDITLTNSANVDIDFTCWGPFSSPTAPCVAQLTYDPGTPGFLQGNCGSGFLEVSSYPCGNTIDCSYNTQATEVVNIPNAQIGEYYILLITNFSGSPTDITASQTGGTGGTDCSIVEPCTINSLTTTPSTCDATSNQYSVTGTVSFLDPPSTGQLIIEDCSGAQLTFNAPFGTSQNYAFLGLASNGVNCNVTATFSDDLTCTFTTNYTAPISCACNADAGTTTISINGNSTNNYVLCDGDQITIQTNNDVTAPLDHGIINGATFSAALGFAIYTCAPTPNTAPLSDPCFSGYFTGTLDSFTETNNGGSSTLLNDLATNGVTVVNNTIFIVPITLYNGASQVYDAACYSLGQTIEVTYLQPITTSFVESCLGNTSAVTINGSYPAFNNSDFTISNLTPSNVTSSGLTIANNTPFTLTGFTAGDNYAFDITDNNGCSASFSEGPFGGLSATTSDTTICNGGTATLAIQINGGAAPFQYSWDNGATSSTITTSPTSSETNCVTVTDAQGCSTGSQCIAVNIHPDITLTTSNDTTICTGDSALIWAHASGGIGAPYIYTWDNGLNNDSAHTVHPTLTKTYNVMVSDGCESPIQNTSITVTVIEPPIFSFSANQTAGCPPLPVLFTAADVPVGYTQTWNFGDGSNTINIANAGHNYTAPGCWDVELTLTSPEGCQTTTTTLDYICIDQPPLVNFNFTPTRPTTFASEVDFNNLTQGGVSYDWVIINGLDSTFYYTENTTHNFPSDQGGEYLVCLASQNSNNCKDSICKKVIIWEDLLLFVPNAFSPNGDNLNDLFIPTISGIVEGSYQFKIFNRWGDIVFETTDVNKGWDGYDFNKSKTDLYIWKINAVDIINNEDHKYSGHVTLLK